MKTISLIFKRSLFVRTTTLAVCFLLASLLASAQSETHNFITYDTSFVTGTGASATTWTMRISRPANMFTANHPDTASRPVIITMPGQGEVGTNPAYLSRYGPHYWLNNGWDGGVQLGNGKHYPILITVISSVVNPRAPVVLPMLQLILNKYRIKRNSVHLAGLSMGGFTWGKLIVYAAYAGDETAMSLVTSLTALQGVSNEVFAPYNAWTMPDWSAYGQWAKKYGGKFFGLEGTSDTRTVWKPRDAMEAQKPGSAFFSFEKYGGGAHCCWNSMYDPNATDWTSSNPNMASNTLHPNSAGTYKKGSSIFQWMLRQGDTSMAGSGVVAPPNTLPVVDAGNVQPVTLPVNAAQLSGTATDADGSITTYAWTKIAGPAQFAFNNAAIANPSVSNLVEGTYTFRLTVTDNRGGSASDNVNVVVNPTAAVVTPPAQQINVNLYGGANAYGNTQWNNWNISGGTTNITSSAFKYADGTASPVKAILSQSTGLGDNTATYQGGMAPAEVLRYTSYSTMSRNLTITGLSASQQYNIELYGSRNNATNNKTIFSAGTAKDTVLTDNNHNDKGILVVTADNTGKIVIALNRVGVYTYLNGFTIKATGAASSRTATIDAAVEQTTTPSFNVFPNPFQDRLVLQVNNDKTGAMKVQIIDMNGAVNREFNLNKSQAGSMQTYLSAGNLSSGQYILRVSIGDWSETQKITKL